MEIALIGIVVVLAFLVVFDSFINQPGSKR